MGFESQEDSFYPGGETGEIKITKASLPSPKKERKKEFLRLKKLDYKRLDVIDLYLWLSNSVTT